MICSLSVAGILIILLLDLRASIMREGALATMNEPGGIPDLLHHPTR